MKTGRFKGPFAVTSSDAAGLLASRRTRALANATALLCLFNAVASAQSLTDFGFNSLPLPPYRWVLVILADYPGQSVVGTDSQWAELMFGSPPALSVANYEVENSNGRFRITAPRGPLRVQMSAADTTTSIKSANPSWNDTQVDAEFLGRIVKSAIDGGFFFDVFDSDHNGVIQCPAELTIVIIHPLSSSGSAGNRGINSQTNAANTLSVAGSVISCDHSVTFDTICHELGHSFGIFNYELYTLRNNANAVNQGMTIMSTTGNGSSGAGLVGTPNWNPGRLHFDPWHKMRFGWSEPRIVSLRVGGRIDLPVASSGAVNGPVLLYDPVQGTHQFIILEYRSRLQSATNYDATFGRDNQFVGEGLVIWQMRTQPDLSPYGSPFVPGDPALYAGFTNNDGSISPGYSSSILCRCPPDLNPFANTPWFSGQTTPSLKWFDGTETATRVRVLPFTQGAASITVEVLAEYDTWVDFTAPPFPQIGTFDYPYGTLQQGVAGVGYGGNLRIKAGSGTASPITITRPMTLTAYGGPVTMN